ncbi:MAG: kelch repeat-containing protein [Candidatus Margulisbacteria bacterium]|nr:kelch repeat-containing protein [Candidatus Margulisiibacteriota bacterium]
MKKILIAGLVLAAATASFFLLGCEEATQLSSTLTVISRAPALNAAEVPIAGAITISFSQSIDNRLMNANNFLRDYVEYGAQHTAGTPRIVLFQWSTEGKTLTLGINSWSLSSTSGSAAKVVHLVPRANFKDIFGNAMTEVLWHYYLPAPASTTTTTASTTTTTQFPASSWFKAGQTGFPGRGAHTVVAGSLSQEKLWVIGGITTGDTMLGDVWSTADGINWVRDTAVAEFGPLAAHTSVIFNNKLWVIAGIKDSSLPLVTNEVWSSGNGANWTLAGRAGFFARFGHSSVVHNGKIWVLGGAGPPQATNEVWSSPDGVNWTLETLAPWPARFYHKSVVFDGRIWVVGGFDGSNCFRDVWHSVDGVTWTQATATTAFSGRINFALASYDSKLWVIAGVDQNSRPLNDAWYSADGITWAPATHNAGYDPRIFPEVAVFKNKIWLVGGVCVEPVETFFNDAWYTPGP